MTALTPAERDLYNALTKTDRQHVAIVKKTLEAWKADTFPEPQPQDFGAPVGTPAWTAVEDAANAFDKAIGSKDDHAVIVAALNVVNAVLAR